MKIHAKRYGNEGHDITTARELKIALENYGGIKDTHFILLKLISNNRH